MGGLTGEQRVSELSSESQDWVPQDLSHRVWEEDIVPIWLGLPRRPLPGLFIGCPTAQNEQSRSLGKLHSDQGRESPRWGAESTDRESGLLGSSLAHVTSEKPPPPLGRGFPSVE